MVRGGLLARGGDACERLGIEGLTGRPARARGDLADRAEAAEGTAFGEPGHVVENRGATVSIRRVVAVGGAGAIVRRGLGVVEHQPDVLMKRRLVGFERAHVVTTVGEDRLHRVLAGSAWPRR